MWPFSTANNEAVDGDGLTLNVTPPASGQPLQPIATPLTAQDNDISIRNPSRPLLTLEPDPAFEAFIRQDQRLGLGYIVRTIIVGGVSFLSGFALGSAHGSTNAVLRYRAENAHHLPTSKAGWYLYQKSRNYHAIIGGVTNGLKDGIRFTGWTLMFLSIEEGLDRARASAFARRGEEERKGQRDVLNTLSAAIATVGINSWWNRLDRFAAMRHTRLAMKFALPYGLAQDGLATLRGDRPWYLDRLLGKPTTQNEKMRI